MEINIYQKVATLIVTIVIVFFYLLAKGAFSIKK